jgi:hypothetical protein
MKYTYNDMKYETLFDFFPSFIKEGGRRSEKLLIFI